MATDLVTIDAPDELKQSVAQCVAWSRAHTIDSPAAFEVAANHLKVIKAQQKQADLFFDPPIKQAYDLHKTLVGRKKLIDDPLKESESIDKQKMLTYQRAQDEKRRAEQLRLQALADEKARRERELLAKKAAQAKKPETQQRYQEAAAAVVAPVVNVESQAPAVDGISTRTVWRVRVVDPARVPRRFMIIDMKKLEGYARAMRDAACVEGCEFYQETLMAAKGA